MKTRLLSLTVVGAAAAAAITGCGLGDGSAAANAGLVRTNVAIAQSASGAAILAFDMDSGPGAGPIRKSQIDSLIVEVTSVDVLPDSEIMRCHPPVGDSANGFHPGDADDSLEHRPGGPRGPGGPSGPGMGGGPEGFAGPGGPRRHDCEPRFHEGPPPPPHNDSLPPDTGWGSRKKDWYSLAVTANGHVDLLHLPTDSVSGLVLAADSLPAGEYGAARLIVSSATIYFDTVVTVGATTFQPHTGYPVLLPHRPNGPMGIMTDGGFTVPAGGGSVILMFDMDSAIRGAHVANGQIFIGPRARPRR